MYLIHSILTHVTRSIHPDLLISITYSCSVKSSIYEDLYYALFCTLVLELSTYTVLTFPISTTVSSETSAIRTQTPGNYPKRNKLRKV